jgi:hypothetical protein
MLLKPLLVFQALFQPEVLFDFLVSVWVQHQPLNVTGARIVNLDQLLLLLRALISIGIADLAVVTGQPRVHLTSCLAHIRNSNLNLA